MKQQKTLLVCVWYEFRNGWVYYMLHILIPISSI